MSRFNGYSYRAHKEAFHGNGELLAFTEAFYFGHKRGNNYDGLAPQYSKTDVKPDKRYSILPTVLKLVGDCTNKTVLDLGCGSGFFTFPIAHRGASMVWGVDNSPTQIALAKELPSPDNISFVEADIFISPLITVDIIVAPFVINYAQSVTILEFFFNKLYRHLNEGGKVIMVVDQPNNADLKRFGAVKTLLGPKADETKIRIDLFKDNNKVCTLSSVYYTDKTLVQLLRRAGFKRITWHMPFISTEGIRALGPKFWKGYIQNPELGYLTAEK